MDKATKFVVTNPGFQVLGTVMELSATYKVVEGKVFYQYYDQFWAKKKSIEVGVALVETVNFYGIECRSIIVESKTHGEVHISTGGSPSYLETLARADRNGLPGGEIASFRGHDLKRMLLLLE